MVRIQQRHLCNAIFHHQPSIIITKVTILFFDYIIRKLIVSFVVLMSIVLSCNKSNYYGTVSSFHLMIRNHSSTTTTTTTKRRTYFQPNTDGSHTIIESKRNEYHSGRSLKGSVSSSNDQPNFSLEPKNEASKKNITTKKRTKRKKQKSDNTLKQIKKDDINKLVQGTLLL